MSYTKAFAKWCKGAASDVIESAIVRGEQMIAAEKNMMIRSSLRKQLEIGRAELARRNNR